MNDKQQNERLASLEATLMILRELLQEIRVDVKDQPTRDEFSKHIEDDRSAEKEISSKIEALNLKIEKHEASLRSMLIKVGIVSGILGIVGGAIIKLIFTK